MKINISIFILYIDNLYCMYNISSLYIYIIYFHIIFIFFTHSSDDGHSDWFRILGFVNNAVDMEVQISLLYLFYFLQIYTQKWDCRSYYSSVFNFVGTLHPFSITAVLIYIPTVYKSSLFFTSPPTVAIYCHFENYDSKKWEVIFPCGFYLNFSDD